MAVYKVAQDVEADDKLLGPFSFRQFIYLIIVAISAALAWGLSRVFIPLAIIPLPLILFFGALALPLRKDQPMEIYLAALVSYYLKPRKRIWIPDGIESLIEITAPKVVEIQRAKTLTQTEAEQRLSYLADIADTEGWAVRHAAQPFAVNSMVTDEYFAAQQTEDILDDNGGIAQSLSVMMHRAAEQHKQEMIAIMRQAPTQQPMQTQPTSPIADPYANLNAPQAVTNPIADTTTAQPQFNPYPTSIHQSVIQPLDANDRVAMPQTTPMQPQQTAQPQTHATHTPTPPPNITLPSTSETTTSPDIISLANNSDLSIETIQREANRINKKKSGDDEVFISLH